MKIVSGGQTGVDRAALDAALQCGIDAGGWCPEGRISEEGTIPDRYPVKELPGAGYNERTRQNVIDSDGTVVICFGAPIGGTERTIEYCKREKKPCLLIDAETVTARQAEKRIQYFINRYAVSTLNVAGPRASEEPRSYVYSREVITRVIELLPTPDD